MYKNHSYRVGNIVNLRNANYKKNYYIARIVCAKDGNGYVHGCYLEDYINPNGSSFHILAERDYSNDIAYRMSQIEGAEITSDWLLDNDFATLDIYDNEVHGELFTFIKDCFGKYNAIEDYHTLIYTDRYQDDNAESFEVVILFNKDTNKVHIVSYTNNQIWNSENFCYDNNYKVSKTYSGKIYEIPELQNILMDLEIDILDNFRV